jgi:hypothetical protein
VETTKGTCLLVSFNVQLCKQVSKVFDWNILILMVSIKMFQCHLDGSGLQSLRRGVSSLVNNFSNGLYRLGSVSIGVNRNGRMLGPIH